MSITHNDLFRLSLNTIKELETPMGIMASAKDELFGCIFGRDSLISALNFLKTYQTTRDPYLLELTKKILTHLAVLQGIEVNIQNGEEPGKIIHEYRQADHEHLTAKKNWPWYVSTDGVLRNYDTVDATPLFLWTVHEYYRQSRDESAMKVLLLAVEKALDWILIYGDSNGDGLIDYQFHPDRVYGGLRTQGWMDSSEALFHEDGTLPRYPIAPIEVQGYAFHALMLWSRHFEKKNTIRARELKERADDLKKTFLEKYVRHDGPIFVVGSAVDGAGKLMRSQRSSIGHVLWSARVRGKDGVCEGILDESLARHVVARILEPDLFVPEAGVRTLSNASCKFSPHGYHNGTIWPHDTSIIAEGFDNYGFHLQAQQIRHALLKAYQHFKTPLELFCFDGEYKEFRLASGQVACRKQAWSAASLLKETCGGVAAYEVQRDTSQSMVNIK